MKRFFPISALILIITILSSCAKEEIQNLKEPSSSELMDRSEMDEVIREQMGERELFYWKNVSDRFIWSAAMQSDHLLSVGFCIDGQKDISGIIHEIDMTTEKWASAREELLELILIEEREARANPRLKAEDILPPHLNSGDWPNIFIEVSALTTVEILRSHPNVRYVEPTGYTLEQSNRSDSGCSNEPNYGINSADYTVGNPNTKVPWTFYEHNIPEAWNTSTGEGKVISIIDTGIGYDQDNLNENFNSGLSTDRGVSSYSTKWSGALWWASLDSPEDDCGHGTSMAGTATAPWSGDGNAVGVAYNSHLVTIRAVEDVVITTSNESAGVRDALRIAAKRSDVISMSIGDPFYNSTVADGIYYANNWGRIIACAAGTSFSFTTWFGVVFPATMSETIAITGVKENPSNITCESCHDGGDVDFVMVMERDNDSNRHSIALALYSDQPSYIGGSSVATSTFAGIASLTWSTYPHWSREQVIERLKESSEYYPNRDGDHGWGRVDAAAAVQTFDYPSAEATK